MGFIKKDIISFNKRSLLNVLHSSKKILESNLKEHSSQSFKNINSHYMIGWHKIITICPFLINCIKKIVDIFTKKKCSSASGKTAYVDLRDLPIFRHM
jgi:hypothetical protein